MKQITWNPAIASYGLFKFTCFYKMNIIGSKISATECCPYNLHLVLFLNSICCGFMIRSDASLSSNVNPFSSRIVCHPHDYHVFGSRCSCLHRFRRFSCKVFVDNKTRKSMNRKKECLTGSIHRLDSQVRLLIRIRIWFVYVRHFVSSFKSSLNRLYSSIGSWDSIIWTF